MIDRNTQLTWTRPDEHGTRTCKQLPSITIDKVERFGAALDGSAGQTVYEICIGDSAVVAWGLGAAQNFVQQVVRSAFEANFADVEFGITA